MTLAAYKQRNKKLHKQLRKQQKQQYNKVFKYWTGAINSDYRKQKYTKSDHLHIATKTQELQNIKKEIKEIKTEQWAKGLGKVLVKTDEDWLNSRVDEMCNYARM